MDILQQIDNPIDLLDDNLSQGPIALRDSLARQCATVANAVLEEGTRAGNAKMALAWAQQALDYGESTGLAEMCKAKALEALGHWKAAAESFRTLRGNNRVAREKERTLKAMIKNLEEGGPHPTTGKSLLSKARVATFNGEINGGSPKKILNRVTEGDTAIRDSQPSTPAQQQTQELFLHVFDPPTIEGNILLRTLWARSGKAIRVASWNAQLMNKVDDPSDARIDDAIKWKAASIGRVVKSDTVSLLVIQEAPGPQLRTSGGKISKQIAEENKFTSALKTHLPEGFEFAQVALSNIKNDREMGEDHIYGWDPSAMTKLEGPTPLQPPTGCTWVARAPSYAIFEVSKWNRTSLLVVSVHAKSVENGSYKATKGDVCMIGKAVRALQDNREATSVLIMGDFNLEPKEAAKQLETSYVRSFGEDCPATNIWRFNGTGSAGKEGHAYTTTASFRPASMVALFRRSLRLRRRMTSRRRTER